MLSQPLFYHQQQKQQCQCPGLHVDHLKELDQVHLSEVGIQNFHKCSILWNTEKRRTCSQKSLELRKWWINNLIQVKEQIFLPSWFDPPILKPEQFSLCQMAQWTFWPQQVQFQCHERPFHITLQNSTTFRSHRRRTVCLEANTSRARLQPSHCPGGCLADFSWAVFKW